MVKNNLVSNESLDIAINKGAVTASCGVSGQLYTLDSQEATPLIQQQAALYEQTVLERAGLANSGSRRILPLYSSGKIARISILEHELAQASSSSDQLVLSSCSNILVGERSISVPSVDFLGRNEEQMAHMGVSIVYPFSSPDVFTVTSLLERDEREVEDILRMSRYIMETVIRRDILGIERGQDLLFEIIADIDPTFSVMQHVANRDIRHQINNAINTSNLYFNLLVSAAHQKNIPKYLLTLLNTTVGINTYLSEILQYCSDEPMDLNMVLNGARELAFDVRADSGCEVDIFLAEDAAGIELSANTVMHLAELLGNAMVNGADSALLSAYLYEDEEEGSMLVLSVANDNTSIPLEHNSLDHIFQHGITRRPHFAPRGGGIGLHSMDQFVSRFRGQIIVSTVSNGYHITHVRKHHGNEVAIQDHITQNDGSQQFSTEFSMLFPLS